VITNAGEDPDAAPLKDKLRGLFPEIPVFVCRHTMKGISLGRGEPAFPIGGFSGCRAFAFAGIAWPEGFFTQLREAGIRVCGSLGFPDHHRYAGGDFSKIFGCASSRNAELIITTAKDVARIPPPYRDALAVAEIEMDFGAGRESFCGLAAAKLGVPGGGKPGTGRV
jgi:tetraacyldisaccharide-1-P 4'-kinase